MKLAFLVIDMQKAFHEGEAGASMNAAAEYINAILPHFRRKGLPVVWIQDRDEEDGVVPGSPGFELLDSLKPQEGEPRVTKEYGNAFNKTPLRELLERQGVDTVILSGYRAENCVLSTYRGAQDLDLTPVLLRQGIASGSPERLRFVEDISSTIGYGFLVKLLE